MTFTLFGKAQTALETISYINSQIEEALKSDRVHSMVDELSLTPDGKLTIDNYMFLGGRKIFSESRSSYIKQLSFQFYKEMILPNDQPVYYVGLQCSSHSSCISRQLPGDPGDKVDDMGINVCNREIALRIENAFKHLLTISSGNGNFKERDPFEN